MSRVASIAELPTTPGRHMARLAVTTDLDGAEVCIWVHALVGERPGPTLTLLAGLHGNEWGHLSFFRQLVQDFDPRAVGGRVLVVANGQSCCLRPTVQGSAR